MYALLGPTQGQTRPDMTRIVAILFVLGQFEVAVEAPKGYVVGAYPDTEIGVRQFLDAIRPALENEPGRFYLCVAYDGPVRELVDSPLANRLGVVESLRTGLRNPGIADAPWIVRSEQIKAYLTSHRRDTLDAMLVEKMCLSLLPPNYMELYPGRAGVREFYRQPRRRPTRRYAERRTSRHTAAR